MDRSSWRPLRPGDEPHPDAPEQPDGPDDAELVAAAREDPYAFTLLYRRYLRQIYLFCLARLGDHEAAEDTTSEVFLKALANLHQYRNGNFAAWLYRIARNCVIDHARRRKPQVTYEQAGGMPDPRPSPEESALLQEERNSLLAGIAALPRDMRAVLELQYAGWTSVQIGEALGKSPGVVRVLGCRALERLRRSLHKQTDSPAGNKPGLLAQEAYNE
ncbi:MAG: sigma-70 family RNA polymerase sigma factor [Chloroflexota bacterium]|nr:sigma-70 family RNA polymerase sigma factor [Chloroflexota bacterium]